MRSLAVLVALGGVAIADPRYAHSPRLPPPVVARPLAPIAAAPAAPAATAGIGADEVLTIPDLLRPVRAEQIPILEKLIEDTPDRDAEEKADYWMRLGTLYAQQFRARRLAGDAGKAKDALLRAVRAFKALTENDAFRAYPKLDVALFYFGYTLASGKYLKEARATFDKLLKNFPASAYVPEAHLAFAEYYFETAQLADAEARYRMVLKFPRSAAYWYAMYKVGWIDLNLQHWPDALEVFYEVARGATGKLHDVAVLDFARTYAMVGKPDKAREAFARVDAAKADAMLAALADAYLATGQADRAGIALRAAAPAASGDLASACALRVKIATATRLVADVEAAGRAWIALRDAGAGGAACRDAALAVVGDGARAQHLAGAFADAAKLYQLALDAAPDAPDRVDVRYWRAEALWAVADAAAAGPAKRSAWEVAADAFGAIARDASVDGARRAAAAQSCVTAWKLAFDLDPELGKLAGPLPAIATLVHARAPAPRAIPAREGKLFDAYEAAVPALVDPDEIGRAKVVGAVLLRRYHQLDTAAPLLAEVVHLPHFADADLAARLWLATLVEAHQLDAARAAADELHARGVAGALAADVDYVRTHALR